MAVPLPVQFIFQSTLPMRGATSGSNAHKLIRCDFNPHSPCGERHICFIFIVCHQNFNPHSPCGERRGLFCRCFCLDLFQSTLPMRGATQVIGNGMQGANISIHTPHAGSDCFPRSTSSCWLISIHTPHAGSDLYCQ